MVPLGDDALDAVTAAAAHGASGVTGKSALPFVYGERTPFDSHSGETGQGGVANSQPEIHPRSPHQSVTALAGASVRHSNYGAVHLKDAAQNEARAMNFTNLAAGNTANSFNLAQTPQGTIAQTNLTEQYEQEEGKATGIALHGPVEWVQRNYVETSRSGSSTDQLVDQQDYTRKITKTRTEVNAEVPHWNPAENLDIIFGTPEVTGNNQMQLIGPIGVKLFDKNEIFGGRAEWTGLSLEPLSVYSAHTRGRDIVLDLQLPEVD